MKITKVGIPSGGTINQVLVKSSGTDYDVEWGNGSGSATPAGLNTQVQFNDGGVFGGDAGFTYNKTTNRLTLGSLVLNDVVDPGVDTDKFLVLTSLGVVSYRNGASVLVDIGGVPTSRTLTINGTSYDLSVNRTWSVGTVTGTGTSGYVTYWNGSSSITGESSLFWDAANDRLGIGTASPSAKLDIVSNTSETNADIIQKISYGTIGQTVVNKTAISISAINASAFDIANSIRHFETGDISLTASVNRYVYGSYYGIKLGTLTTTGVSGIPTPHYHINLGNMTGGSDESMYGIYIGTITGGAGSYGVHSNVASGTNRWNFYAAGTANNYFNGNVLIGSTTDSGETLQVSGRAKIYSSSSTNLVVENTGSNGSFIGMKDASGSFAYVGANNGDFLVQTPSGSYSTKLTIANSGAATFSNSLTVNSIANATTDTDKFIVSDSGVLKYRTGSEVLTDIGAQAALTNPVTGTGTTNYVTKWTGSSSVGNSIMYESGAAIVIDGNISVRGDWSATYPIYQMNDTRVGGAVWNLENGRTLSQLSFYASGAGTLMSLTTGGNLLIGTTTDSGEKLQVNGTGKFTGNVTINSGGDNFTLARSGFTNFNFGVGTVAGINGLHIGAGSSTYISIDESTAAATFSTDTVTITSGAGTYPRLISRVGAKSWEIGYRSGTTNYEIREDGTTRFAIANGGAATFSNSVTANTDLILTRGTNGINKLYFNIDNSNYGYILSNSSSGEQRYYIGPSSGWGGYHTWYTDNTEKMRLDSAGNLGLGVTPSGSWFNGSSVLQFGATGALWNNGTNNSGFSHNVVFNNVDARYIITSAASYYRQLSGQHNWFTAPSGTAGDAITFTQAMTLDASGKLGIGTTNPQSTVHLETASANGAAIRMVSNSTNGRSYAIGSNFITGIGEFGIYDYTAGAERMRITANGRLLLGTTTEGSELLQVAGTGKFTGQLNVMGYFSVYSDANNMGALGFNRNAANGAIYNSSYSAYQLQNVNGDMLLSAFNSSGTYQGNYLTIASTGAASFASSVTADSAFIGQVPTYGSTFAQFSHKNRAGVGEYSFLSENTGNTFINSKTGYSIYFRINNSDVAVIASTGQLKLNNYTSTSSFTGTAAGVLAFDSSGNILTIATPGGGSGITSLNTLNASSQTFATGTSGTDFNISSATSTHTFNLPTASATNRGLLSTTDWSTFNGKQNALTNPVTGTGTNNELAYFNSTGSTIASLSTATYPSLTELSYVKGVTSAIQTQLNAKEPTLTKGNLTESTSSVLTITGGTGAVIGSGTTIQVKQASGSQSGFLSSTDWTTFNNKGSGTIGGSTGSTDNAILRADGTGGSTVQSSAVSITDAGDVYLGLSGTSGLTRSITTQGSETNVDLNISTKGDATLDLSSNIINSISASTNTVASNLSNVDLLVYSGKTCNAKITDAGTNSISYPLTVIHTPGAVSSGNGIGVGIKFDTQTAVGNTETGSIIESVSTDVTSTSEDFDLVFKTMAAGAAAAEQVRITSGGILNLAKGQVQFPATANPSTNANTLDDYEEGTWTPTLSATGNTFSYSSRVGAYTKIGNKVYVTFRIQLNTSGNTLVGNAVTLTSLPFTSANVTNQIYLGETAWQNFSTSMIRAPFQLPINSTTLTMYKITAATANVTTTLVGTDLNATSGSIIYGTLTYFV